MENASPHSYVIRARELERAKARPNPRTGKFRPAPTPSPVEVAILRRIARGHLLVTQKTDERGGSSTHYCYDDGMALPHYGKMGFSLHKFVSNGWLVAVPGETLIAGAPAQRYVVPR